MEIGSFLLPSCSGWLWVARSHTVDVSLVKTFAKAEGFRRRLKGLRERLAVGATDGEQVGESAEEGLRTLWVSVDEHGDGRSGNKSVVKSSPTLLTMAGVSTTRDRTVLSICSGTGFEMARTP